MKYAFIFLLLCFPYYLSFAQKPGNNFELPATWDKNFNISYYSGGGMVQRSTKLFLSKDSCAYVEMKEGIDDKKTFKFSVAELAQILAKLKELKADKIKTKKLKGIIYDKESEDVCFTSKDKELCLQDGATATIEAKDQQRYFETIKYLFEMTRKKVR